VKKNLIGDRTFGKRPTAARLGRILFRVETFQLLEKKTTEAKEKINLEMSSTRSNYLLTTFGRLTRIPQKNYNDDVLRANL